MLPGQIHGWILTYTPTALICIWISSYTGNSSNTWIAWNSIKLSAQNQTIGKPNQWISRTCTRMSCEAVRRCCLDGEAGDAMARKLVGFWTAEQGSHKEHGSLFHCHPEAFRVACMRLRWGGGGPTQRHFRCLRAPCRPEAFEEPAVAWGGEAADRLTAVSGACKRLREAKGLRQAAARS
jgi:hypothetical protein